MLLGRARDPETPQLRQRPGAGLLLVERLAGDPGGAAHESERAALEMRQHGVGDRDVVEREIELGEAQVGVVDAFRMGQPHAQEVDDLVAARGERASAARGRAAPPTAGRHRVAPPPSTVPGRSRTTGTDGPSSAG
jgi:hypothetical protein